MAGWHVFIPELIRPLALWQQDFGFQPEAPELVNLLSTSQTGKMPANTLLNTLAYCLRLDQQPPLPWAVLRHQFESAGMYAAPLLCADPVHLHSGSDSVVYDPQPLQLTRLETESLLATLNQHLQQDNLLLTAFHPDRWYLSVLDKQAELPAAIPQTTPLTTLAQNSILAALPVGTGSQYWRRLFDELQMLLHCHEVNQERQQRGQKTVNALWFWGEGEPQPAPDTSKQVTRFHGGGFAVEVLANYVQAEYSALPKPTLTVDGDTHFLILDTLLPAAQQDNPQQWQQAMTALQPLFQQLRQQLAAGQPVTVYDTAGCFWSCQQAGFWQFWRKARRSSRTLLDLI